jgi:hypothetical protein
MPVFYVQLDAEFSLCLSLHHTNVGLDIISVVYVPLFNSVAY